MSTDATMAARRQRLHDERDVPEGHELVARWAGPHWQLDSGHRCRYARHGHDVCGKPSEAALLRGEKRPHWWAYCPEHMYGRWIEDGQVMHWILQVKPGHESLHGAR